jgi:acetylornithine deacetylase/succinyl-diaminopimelate desuccinylase-like protein
MNQVSRKIDYYLDQHLDDFVDETVLLCSQPSVSATGEGVLDCAKMVKEILEKHGFNVDWFETAGNPIIVGRCFGTESVQNPDRTLLFYNHYDVQPPEPLELWTSPPFLPTIRDGCLYARGVSDDKGEFIARLAAVEAVRSAYNGKLPCNVTFVVEGEEEIGSPNIAQFVNQNRDLLKSQAAIWEVGGVDPDGQPGTTLGVRGILGIELSVEKLSRDAHSGSAHTLPSAAWYLVRALNSLKDDREVILIPGWYDDVLPANEKDIALYALQPNHEEYTRESLGIKQFLNGLTGINLKKAVFNPTCNIQGINTGYQGKGLKTIVPARASAKLDFRLVPRQDPDDLEQKLKDHLIFKGFEDVKVKRLGAMWPYKADSDDPFIKMATQKAEEVYKVPLLVDPLAGGSSPIYAFAEPLGGIPVLWAGINGANSRAHSPNENIELKNFRNGTRYLARILDGFSRL